MTTVILNEHHNVQILVKVVSAAGDALVDHTNAAFVISNSSGSISGGAARNNGYLLAAVKIVLSILLVGKFGIAGAVLGTAIAYWTVDFGYNPKLVYDKVFHLPVRRYVLLVLGRLAMALGIGLGSWWLWRKFFAPHAITGVLPLIINIVILGIIVLIVTAALYAMFFPGFRHLIARGRNVLARRRQKKTDRQGQKE